MAEKRRGLGRGIGALIPESQTENRYSPIDVFFNNPHEDKKPNAISDVSRETLASDTAGNSRKSKNATEKTERSKSVRTRGDSDAAGSFVATKSATMPDIEQAGPHGKGGNSQPVAKSKKSVSRKKESTAKDATRSKSDNITENSVRVNMNGDVSRETSEELLPVPGATFGEIPVEQIVPNTKQPRQVFDEEDLQELADSIKEVGVLQPIVVRPLVAPISEYPDARYELIMGERRWRASQLAGNKVVPAVVRRTEDGDLLRDALLENLHRAQLNALEEAAAYQQLLDDFGCTQEELSRRIARSRPQISNTLRLLKLPPLVQRRVAAGVISAGHARALLGLPDPAAMERVAQKIVAEGLSVRAVEELVAMGDDTQPKIKRATGARAQVPELADIAAQLGDTFDTRVKITMGQRKGKITIDFASMDDLERILNVIKRD
ncbi:ParB family chromosome partitioning protein [Arcanobacterium pluranimalium]|uniref:ParB/RepB/Spo0J family partition protein n=1 Tax=Arcanobacterium pluranimalium TaxID=108028 RepID=UPI00195E93A7|nr:ParB/RepB/Spo0J family partition protein [Arcanobacterium pluranimalium]MBM7824449.1 ParB family chromosome partitioning protein [Arcanobacterium pluranimalium]